MKKLKVLTAILLALMFVLFAMGSGSGEPVENDDIVINDNVDIGEPTEAPEAVKKTVSRGTISGNVYTNDFAGFTFTKPSDWVYATDEEIAQTINAGQSMLDLSLLEEALSTTASIYDMYAVDDYGNNVMVCYENTMLTAFRELTVDEYVESFKTQLLSVDTYDYELSSTEDITLGGTAYKKVVATADYNGYTITQAYYITIIDNYAVSIILTSSTMDIAEMEAMIG